MGKMDQETTRLSWKTFPAQLAVTCSDLLTDNNFSDVTLVSDDQIQFKAHRFVLSACSPVLKDILLDNPHPYPLLYLRGVKQHEVLSILEFMYLGEVNIHKDSLNMFMDVVNDLKIKELSHDYKSNDLLKDVKIEKDEHAINISDEILDFKYPEPKLDEMTETIIKADKDSLKCQHCELIFSSEKNMTRHYILRHKGMGYPCEYCDSTFSINSSLRRHQSSKHEGVQYSCDQCESILSDKSSLRRHQSSKHQGIQYPCDQCDIIFNDKSNLTRHQESIHQGIRYFCNLCDISFVANRSLRSHKLNKH